MSSIPTIPSVLYKYVENRPNKVINHISPSQIGRCMRAHYYEIKHLEHTTPPNPGALLNFEVGFLWEQVMASACEQQHIPFMYQYRIYDESLDMEGTLDFGVHDPVNQTWEIWDSKTESEKAMARRDRVKGDYFVEHPEYVHQLNAYCLMMRNKGFTVSQGRFGVISKDNGRIKEYVTQFPETSLKATLDRILTLKGYLERDEVPPCECEGWRVGYCNYGLPSTRAQNTTKKWVNTECCGTMEEIEQWSKETMKEKEK